jgi:hypothetical protein
LRPHYSILMLTRIGKLVFGVVVYVYFTAWIYVHFYYEEFGISTSTIRIDYRSYLIFSWNVFASLHFLIITAALAAAGGFSYYLIKRTYRKKKKAFSIEPKKQFILLVTGLILLFPYLFYHGRYCALANYRNDRIHTGYLKSIQFVFRQGADFLSPTFAQDSLKNLPEELSADIKLIRRDKFQQLKLLGESDDKFIILNQSPYDDSLQKIPEGYIYFIAKSDVLVSKITLGSSQ